MAYLEFDFPEKSKIFAGAGYDPIRDNKRLVGQLEKIVKVMMEGDWYTLQFIESLTDCQQTSISAQLRHLRKERFGNNIVEREYIKDGLYKYRVTFSQEFKDKFLK